MPADIHVIVDDGIADFAITVHTDIVPDHTLLYPAAGDHRATGDDGIKCHAHALGIGKDKFRGRILVLPGSQRPVAVVQVENGRHAHKIHVRFVVGIEGSNVAPIQCVLLVFVHEVISKHPVLRNNPRKNVLAEIVVRLGILGVGQKYGDHELRIENVNTHRSVAMARTMRRVLGLGWLFFESHDPPIVIDFNHSELPRGLRGGNLDGSDRHVSGGVHVLLQHLGVVHFVYVVAGKNKHVLRALAADRIYVLIDGVSSALIPLL